MSRLYLLQSWTNAAEEDYHLSAGYSGEQIGNRNAPSKQAHIKQNGRQWYANLDAYREEEEPKKGRKKKEEEPLEYKVFPQQKKLDDVDKLSTALQGQYREGRIATTQYIEMMIALEERREKAFKALSKAKGWHSDTEEGETHTGIDYGGLLYQIAYCVLCLIGVLFIAML